MRDHLRLRLAVALVGAGGLALLAAFVLAPLAAAGALIIAAALLATLLGWPGGLAALALILLVDGGVAKGAVAAAAVLPVGVLFAWQRRAERGQRIRAAAAAEERARLAREMHDSLSKTLDAIALGAAALPDSLDEPDRATRLAATLRDGSLDAARDARGLIEELRTSPATAPLPDLVAAISQDWSAGTGVGVILHTAGLERGAAGDAGPQVVIELCWILREALRNVAAHARAATVAVTLERDGGGLVLEVRDDGAGFAVPDTFANLQRNGHHGLVGMQERAKIVGGHLTVWARPGGGTRVTATVPAVAMSATVRPSRKVRLLVGAAAVAVPLALVAFLTAPQERVSPFFAQETGVPLDPRATHGAVSPTAGPVTPQKTSASPSRSASAQKSTATSEAPAAPVSPVASSAAPAGGGCRVSYVKRSEWNPGFVADLKLTNLGTAPVEGWSLRFEYGAGQKLTSYWNGVASQTGAVIVVGPTGDSPRLGAGASVTIGLQGTWSGTNPNPSVFSLNGSVCG